MFRIHVGDQQERAVGLVMKPYTTKRSLRIRQLNFARQLLREAERAGTNLDALYLERRDQLPFDPGAPHSITVETREHSNEQPLGRVTCTCGADSGWLSLSDMELRAHWHRRQAEKSTRPGSDRVGDSELRAEGVQEAPMFDRTLFATLARYTRKESVHRSPVVPLPILDGQQPLFLVFDERDFAIDLAYERRPQAGGTRIRSAPASDAYWIPRSTPVFAVSDGVIVYARQQGDGHTIVIDHGNNWLSAYHRLEHMFLAPTERTLQHEIHVAGGHVLGYLAPSDRSIWRPLRFELWKRGPSKDELQQMDPLRYIRKWNCIDWNNPQRGGRP